MARHCLPGDSRELTERIDSTLSLQAMAALAIDPSADWLPIYRMHADPHRLVGFGPSSLAAGRHTAFLGAIWMAIPPSSPPARSSTACASRADGSSGPARLMVHAGSWRQYIASRAAAEAAWAFDAQMVQAGYCTLGPLRALLLSATDMPIGGGLQAALASDLAQLHDRGRCSCANAPTGSGMPNVLIRQPQQRGRALHDGIPGRNRGYRPPVGLHADPLLPVAA